jgi:DNA-binding NtrC family response regulator
VPKSILVVAHDRPLREARVQLLQYAGFTVKSVETDDDAMAILETEQFDLILLGRNSRLPQKQIDQRLREKYPDLLILKIQSAGETERSIYPSRLTDSQPRHVVEALHEMLGDGVRLVPLEPPANISEGG